MGPFSSLCCNFWKRFIEFLNKFEVSHFLMASAAQEPGYSSHILQPPYSGSFFNYPVGVLVIQLG